MLLLHISDIHFRQDEIGSALDPNAALRNELLRDAQNFCAQLKATPEAILVSGDLTYAATSAEFEYALSWLDDLCQACGTTLTSIFVIPGNHDVARAIASRALIQSLHRDIKNASNVALESIMHGLLKDEEAGRLLYEALGPYNTFASQFFCDLLPPERTIARRDLVLNDGSTLRVSGFNSAFVSSSADAKGDLFVDPACFQLIKERGVEHVTLCHHPFTWLRQGDALKDHLADVAKLQLFGHEHINRIEMGRDWVRIAASAAHPDRTEAGWEPGYNLIELEVKDSGGNRWLEVKVHVRVWQLRPAEFRAKMDHGSDVFTQLIRLDPWLRASFDEPAHAAPGTAAKRISKSEDLIQAAGIDPMDSLRNISVRFFKLSLSQKSAIAGKLDLLDDEDANQPTFEQFRRAFIRARERGLIEALDREVKAAVEKAG